MKLSDIGGLLKVFIAAVLFCHSAIAAGTQEETKVRSMKRSSEAWIDRMAPAFSMELFGGDTISSDDLAGSSYLLYFWFSGCPPCMKLSSQLPGLQEKFGRTGFTIVAVNADRFIGLETTDEERIAYVRKHGYDFPVGHLNKEMNDNYGAIEVFPTFFLVDGNGIVRKHRYGYQPLQVLAGDIESLLTELNNLGKGKL